MLMSLSLADSNVHEEVWLMANMEENYQTCENSS